MRHSRAWYCATPLVLGLIIAADAIAGKPAPQPTPTPVAEPTPGPVGDPPAYLLWSKKGEVPSYLGSACSGVDFNGDGFKDVLTAAAGYSTKSMYMQGKVYVWSGKDPNELLFSALGEGKSNEFGMWSVNAGDVNGDGIEDIVVPAHGWNRFYGKIYVYGGIDPNDPEDTVQLLFTKDGQSLGLTTDAFFARIGIARSPGDFDGDGFQDVAVSAFNDKSGNGTVFVWSGQDPDRLLYTVTGTEAGNLGFNLTFANVNGDAFSDLVVSEHLASSGQGQIRVYLGPDGTEAAHSPIRGEGPGDNFGYSLASVGDFDGDGNEDIVAGAPNRSSSGYLKNGKIYVLSGSTGSPLAEWEGLADLAHAGHIVDGAGDFDQDGTPDIVTLIVDFREILVLGGPDLRTIFSLQRSAGYWHGACSLGDTNGDGWPEIMVTLPYADPNAYGQIFVFSGQDPGGP